MTGLTDQRDVTGDSTITVVAGAISRPNGPMDPANEAPGLLPMVRPATT